MTLTTKGALVWELNEPWTVEEIEIGDPRRGEVTVQLETADPLIVTGSTRSTPAPVGE